jgi:hypothetical protein
MGADLRKFFRHIHERPTLQNALKVSGSNLLGRVPLFHQDALHGVLGSSTVLSFVSKRIILDQHGRRCRHGQNQTIYNRG